MKGVSAFGWLMAAFGAFACVLLLVHVREQPADAFDIRFLVSAGVGALGVLIARRARKAVPRIDAREAEQHILRAAQAHDGRITAAEVAAEAPVPLAQATEMLEALCKRSLCRMSIAEAGILVFEFSEFQKAEPKSEQVEEAAATAARAAARSQRTSE